MNKKNNKNNGIFNGWGNVIFLILILTAVASFFCGLLIPIFKVPIMDVSSLNWAFKFGGIVLIILTVGISFVKFNLHSFFKFILDWMYRILFKKDPKKRR